MLTRYSTLLAVVAALGTPAPAPAADPFAETVEQANKKLVKVFGAGGFSRLNNYGTGIIICKDGHILTVASQLLDTSELVVHLYDGRRLQGAGDRRGTANSMSRWSRFKVEGKKIDEPNGLDLDYFDFAEAVKRPRPRPATGCWPSRNTFEIALRDEPMSVQRGVVSAYTKLAGRRGIFDFPYTGDVYVVDAITNNPGAAGGALTDRKGEPPRHHRPRDQEHADRHVDELRHPCRCKDRREDEGDGQGQGRQGRGGREDGDHLDAGVRRAGRCKGEYKPVQRDAVLAGQGGYHGIMFVPNVLERTPAYVEDVVAGSPADKAGLRPDDLVSFVDGEPIISIKAFDEFIRRNTRAGTVVRLEVRRGEALQTVELTLGAHPPKPKPPTPAPPKP